MDGTTQHSTKDGTAILGLSLWIAAAATVAWMMLWFVTGNFWSSLVAILASMTFLVVRLSAPTFTRHEKVEGVQGSRTELPAN